MEDASSHSRAFDRLPPNIIEHILYAADANTFASLALLNSQWRQISESTALYSHQLSKCPTFLWSRGVAPALESDGLTSLKRRFLEEVRRNAFDVFLRPRKTLVRLISSSMSSSTAFPNGEVFRFSFSANGHMVLCISSSRIVVIALAADPVAVKHEFQTRRRPLGATIVDDGSLLAVLSSSHRVNIYRLSNDEVKQIQSITLNDAPRDLAFSPTGSVLALSYERNIEPRAAFESMRWHFPPDGSLLLGSSVDREHDGLVTISAPFYTETGDDASPEEIQMRMWTTQILFPEMAQDLTHACLISEHDEGDDSWILAYDVPLAAFKALKVNNVNAGRVYFASPFLDEESREMLPTMLPTTDQAGELAALGFQDSKLWLYGIPKNLDVASVESSAGSVSNGRTWMGGTHHSAGHAAPRDNLAQLNKIIPQSKVLVRGRPIMDISGITSARWIHSASLVKPKRRLVAVAPGGVRPQVFGDEDVPVDGGRILILDFERTTTNGGEEELDIEIGETYAKMLKEPDSSLDTEVELERRRTRLVRNDTEVAVPGLQRRTSRAPNHNQQRNSLVVPAMPTSPAGVVASNGVPRSQDTLRRAATAAASTRGRYDPRYRNSPSRRQIPHESDADNWVPPPPPYKREADEPLPDHLRETLLPPQDSASNQITPRAIHPPHRSKRTKCDFGVDEWLSTGEDPLSGIGSLPQQILANPASRIASTQPLPTLAIHPAELQNHGPLHAPSLGATVLGENYFSYAVSSPNLLHIPQPQGDGLDSADDDENIPARQRSFRRRVSTEPTSLPPPSNEEWRRRIEDWNEHTIRERSRKKRGKCVVM
ncbi:hypothetical protein N7468_005140 [Penicillium chermesinum]|uniref:F-box domain-containing protein n=1 Tax=Penicillium chermesinum TaxID=63820 RepID=A0A9W9NYP1_9EURO|nr:uncharacterized protein N7468_005140 [Penicillium chermesinum]KAJ5232184.1 hypothetical protein N7468_005140 [Penicillium chermesinum]